jgi:hypothetical protein
MLFLFDQCSRVFDRCYELIFFATEFALFTTVLHFFTTPPSFFTTPLQTVMFAQVRQSAVISEDAGTRYTKLKYLVMHCAKISSLNRDCWQTVSV